MPSPRPLQSETTGARPVWLLTVSWRGKTYRWSTIPITIQTGAGETLPYPGGLGDTSISEAIARGSIGAATVPLRVRFDEDLIAMSVRGHRLSTARGYVDMVTTRDEATAVQTWEGRYRYISGRIVLPQFGEYGQPPGGAAFSLETSVGEDRGRILPPASAISVYTWPTCRTTAVGKVIPRVFGSPGYYSIGGTATTTEGSPAYPVEDAAGTTDTLAIAWGHCTGTQVTIFADAIASFTATPVKEWDTLGNAVTTVDISGKSAAIRTASSYWVGWNAATGTRLPYSGTDHQGAGDILRLLWTSSTVPVDHGAWASVAGALNNVKLGFYVNDIDVSPSEWALGNTADLLPLEMIAGPDGWCPVLDELEVSSQQVRHIVEGPDFRWVGPLSEDQTPGDLISSYTLRYAARGSTGDFKRTITIASKAADGGIFEAQAMVDAELMGAVDAALIKETRLIHDEASAGRVARYQARRLSTLPQFGVFSAAPSYGWLSPGDKAAITSTHLGVTALVTEIRGKRWMGGRWIYGVRWPYGLSGARR